jgi:hypothetical protein
MSASRKTIQYPGADLIHAKGKIMNSVIYIVGLVVVIIAVMSFFGMR